MAPISAAFFIALQMALLGPGTSRAHTSTETSNVEDHTEQMPSRSSGRGPLEPSPQGAEKNPGPRPRTTRGSRSQDPHHRPGPRPAGAPFSEVRVLSWTSGPGPRLYRSREAFGAGTGSFWCAVLEPALSGAQVSEPAPSGAQVSAPARGGREPDPPGKKRGGSG